MHHLFYTCILLKVKMKHTIKAYEGVKLYIHTFLTSSLDGAGWSALRSSRLGLEKIDPGIHQMKAWVDPRAGVGMY